MSEEVAEVEDVERDHDEVVSPDTDDPDYVFLVEEES